MSKVPNYTTDPKSAELVIQELLSRKLIDEKEAVALRLLTPDEICWKALVLSGIGIEP